MILKKNNLTVQERNKFYIELIVLLLVFSVTQFKIDQNKNQDHSID